MKPESAQVHLWILSDHHHILLQASYRNLNGKVYPYVPAALTSPELVPELTGLARLKASTAESTARSTTTGSRILGDC